jgi:hypothetical protein
MTAMLVQVHGKGCSFGEAGGVDVVGASMGLEVLCAGDR